MAQITLGRALAWLSLVAIAHGLEGCLNVTSKFPKCVVSVPDSVLNAYPLLNSICRSRLDALLQQLKVLAVQTRWTCLVSSPHIRPASSLQ